MAPGGEHGTTGGLRGYPAFKPVETFAKGMGMTGQADSEHFREDGRHWFAEGWAGKYRASR
jgi:hypothetical protein